MLACFSERALHLERFSASRRGRSCRLRRTIFWVVFDEPTPRFARKKRLPQPNQFPKQSNVPGGSLNPTFISSSAGQRTHRWLCGIEMCVIFNRPGELAVTRRSSNGSTNQAVVMHLLNSAQEVSGRTGCESFCILWPCSGERWS